MTPFYQLIVNSIGSYIEWVLAILVLVVKRKVKKAVDFIFQFETNIAAYCKKKGYDGVICGHIHHAEIKNVDGIVYMNDGDWVESYTALVEHTNGRWEIVTWRQESDNVFDDIDSSTSEQSKRHTRSDNS